MSWRELGTVAVANDASMLAGLAVTSHNAPSVHGAHLNRAGVDHVVVEGADPHLNVLIDGGFEQQTPPRLTPAWRSDYPLRQTPAKSERHQPRSGDQNGACWSVAYQDCGLYQDVVAPSTATYTLTFHATADRPGGLIGADLNGVLAATASVQPRPFGDYGEAYVMTFRADAGDLIRVWMYSPVVPGYVVIDDVSLTTVDSGTSPVVAVPEALIRETGDPNGARVFFKATASDADGDAGP